MRTTGQNIRLMLQRIILRNNLSLSMSLHATGSQLDESLDGHQLGEEHGSAMYSFGALGAFFLVVLSFC